MEIEGTIRQVWICRNTITDNHRQSQTNVNKRRHTQTERKQTIHKTRFQLILPGDRMYKQFEILKWCKLCSKGWSTSPKCEMKNFPKYQSQGKSEIQNERSRCGQVVVVVVGKGTCGVTWMRRRLFYISTTGCTASTCTSTCTASTCANTQSELHRRLDAPSPLKHFYIWMRRFTTVCANVLDDAPPLREDF